MTLADRFRAMRERASLSQHDVAVAICANQSAVSKIESGARNLSAVEVGLLADKLGWDPRELLGIERPASKMVVAQRLRSLDGSSTAAVVRAAALVEVDAMLDELSRPGAARGLTFDWPTPVRANQARQQGQQLADEIRTQLGIEGAITDLVGLAEGQLGIDVLYEPLGNGCDGLAATAESLALAVIDTTVVSGRQRFTLAHEICHIVSGDVTDVVRIDTHDDGPAEERAHGFASALLMPETALRRVVTATPDEVTLTESMMTFGVSWAALKRRLRDLAISVPAEIAALDGDQIFARAGRSSDAALSRPTGHRRLPARLVRRVTSAYRDAYIGEGVVAMAFGLDAEGLAEFVRANPVSLVPEPLSADELDF